MVTERKKNFVYAILGEKEFLQVYFRHLKGALLHLEALSGSGLRVVGWYCARRLYIPFLVRQRHEMCANARMSSHLGAANWSILINCRYVSLN